MSQQCVCMYVPSDSQGMSLLEGNLNSIAEVAASGLLKVPEIKEPVNLQQTSKQTGARMSIADAAKTGLLKVPTAGEKKGQTGQQVID